jgi:hypothetical protein
MSTTPTDLRELVADAQKQAISSLKQAQDFSVRATQLAVGLLPAGHGAFDGRMPTSKDVVEATYGFAGQVLELHRSYALRLADAFDAAAGRAAEATKPAKG